VCAARRIPSRFAPARFADTVIESGARPLTESGRLGSYTIGTCGVDAVVDRLIGNRRR